MSDDGLTTGADSAGSIAGGTVDGRTRDKTSAASSADPLPRKQCACAILDPVMQADMRFYCHRCSFQVAAVLCADCRQHIVALAAADPALRTLSQQWREGAVELYKRSKALGLEEALIINGMARGMEACAADLDRVCPEIRDEQTAKSTTDPV